MDVKKIVITGDSCSGKTTLAKNLSDITKIPYYSTDDYYWIKKFTIKAKKEESIKRIRKVFSYNRWIVEGSTMHLLEGGLEIADRIIYLGHKNIFNQYHILFKRHRGRSNERFFDLIDLVKHIFIKRYSLKDYKKIPLILKQLEKFNSKLVKLYSFKEIDSFVETIRKNHL